MFDSSSLFLLAAALEQLVYPLMDEDMDGKCARPAPGRSCRRLKNQMPRLMIGAGNGSI